MKINIKILSLYIKMSLSHEKLLENTYFINLEHRVDRLIHVRTELNKLMPNIGIRFNAIKANSGAVGCTLSHIKCLEQAKAIGLPHVFICEDDICFRDPQLLMKNMKKFCDTVPQWDVLIIGGNNVPPYQQIGDFCARISNCQTTTGYIVRDHYYDILISNFREGLKKLISEPVNKREYAIDMYWKRLQTSDLWFFIIPPTVCQIEGFSDIEGKQTNYAHLMLDMNKEWLLQQQALMNNGILQQRPDKPVQNQIDLGIKYRGSNSINGSLKFN
jgi:glycosyl transferase family 25